jgi:ribulose-5-phosphate 4-epimerase/fuculose-1-phosphate aldolase
MLLAHHGPSVYGADLASAADAVEDLGETARLHLLLHDRVEGGRRRRRRYRSSGDRSCASMPGGVDRHFAG